MIPFVILSGCSGGGKSVLLDELSRRGHTVIPEPGRRIVQEEIRRGGHALPWQDMPAFLRRTITLAQEDYTHALRHTGHWVFFDRSLIDAATALHFPADPEALQRVTENYRYYPHVFLTPPWPEIYVQDPERRHDLQAAQEEYQRLLLSYPALGYTVHVLPKFSVLERAEYVLDMLDSTASRRPA
ncbi:AAA family ATPase [Kerstersia similis]|uniref:AAA family ATPase n=1 Tax=Kerstersia similis TaxID=206505 RepID=UPI0039EF0EC9